MCNLEVFWNPTIVDSSGIWAFILVFLKHVLPTSFKAVKSQIEASPLHEAYPCVRYIGKMCVYRRYVYPGVGMGRKRNMGMGRQWNMGMGRQRNMDMARQRNMGIGRQRNVGRQGAADGFVFNVPLPINRYHDPGPKRNSRYDPSVGFEPYWAGGDWVFETPTTDPSVTETGLMCGDQCSPVYLRYGRICGRNLDRKTKDFPNYCVMRNEDCHDRHGWYIAHRGKCRGDLPIYYTLVDLSTRPPFEYILNVSEILYGFSSRHPHLYPASASRNTTPTKK